MLAVCGPEQAIKLGDFCGSDAFRPGYLLRGAGELGQRGGFVGFGCSGIFGGVFGVLLCFVAILAKGGGEPCAFIVALAFAVGAKDLMGFGVTANFNSQPREGGWDPAPISTAAS